MDKLSASASEGASAPALVFRPPEPDAFPWAGAVLLTFLLVVAVLAKWRNRSGGGGLFSSRLQRWARSGSPAPRDDSALAVEQRLRLADGTQLHVIRWSNRRVLVATTPHAAPVALDRADTASGGTP